MRKTCCSQGKVRGGIVLLSMEREERERKKEKEKENAFLACTPTLLYLASSFLVLFGRLGFLGIGGGAWLKNQSVTSFIWAIVSILDVEPQKSIPVGLLIMINPSDPVIFAISQNFSKTETKTVMTNVYSGDVNGELKKKNLFHETISTLAE